MDEFEIKSLDQSNEDRTPCPPNSDVTGIFANPKILFLGNQASGKSTCMINLLNNRNILGGYYQRVYLWGNYPSDTPWKALKDWNNPRKFVKLGNEYKDEDLQKILDLQEQDIYEYGYKNGTRSLIVLDDFLSMKEMFEKHALFLKVLTEGRHYNLSLFCGVQSFKVIPPPFRKSFSNIMIFHNVSEMDLKHCSEEYCRACRPRDFINMFNQNIRGGFDFLHIARETHSNDDLYRKGLAQILQPYDENNLNSIDLLQQSSAQPVKPKADNTEGDDEDNDEPETKSEIPQAKADIKSETPQVNIQPPKKLMRTRKKPAYQLGSLVDSTPKK